MVSDRVRAAGVRPEAWSSGATAVVGAGRGEGGVGGVGRDCQSAAFVMKQKRDRGSDSVCMYVKECDRGAERKAGPFRQLERRVR